LHESKIIDHSEADSIDNLVSIVSIKWTTARLIAEKCTNVVVKKLGNSQKCATRHTPIPSLGCERNLAHLSDQQLKQACITHIEKTMCMNMTDFLLRRTDDFITNQLNEHQLQRILTTFSNYYNWSNERQHQEIESLLNTFLLPETHTTLKNIHNTIS